MLETFVLSDLTRRHGVDLTNGKVIFVDLLPTRSVRLAVRGFIMYLCNILSLLMLVLQNWIEHRGFWCHQGAQHVLVSLRCGSSYLQSSAVIQRQD